MSILVLAVLMGAVVFLAGVVMRRRKVILFGTPAVLILALWFFLAAAHPDPEKEFDRLFGAGHRGQASGIETIKPVFMDGHFISFRMAAVDFESRIRPQLAPMDLASPPNLLLGQSLPAGWPAAVETAASVLHREVQHQDVFLVYFPEQEMAYASVRYDQW